MAVNKPIHYVVIHCSASPHRGDSAADVHKWHEERGWSGIGYHYTIDELGDVEAGRPEYWVGAHVKDSNQGTLGIMLFGRGPQDFNDLQFSKLRALCFELKYRYPNVQFVGHCDLDKNKPNCPGFDVSKWAREQGLS